MKVDSSEIILAVHQLAVAFEKAEVRYFLTGSMASSMRGVPRATMDVDVVAAINRPHISRFAQAMCDTF